MEENSLPFWWQQFRGVLNIQAGLERTLMAYWATIRLPVKTFNMSAISSRAPS